MGNMRYHLSNAFTSGYVEFFLLSSDDIVNILDYRQFHKSPIYFARCLGKIALDKVCGSCLNLN